MKFAKLQYYFYNDLSANDVSRVYYQSPYYAYVKAAKYSKIRRRIETSRRA